MANTLVIKTVNVTYIMYVLKLSEEFFNQTLRVFAKKYLCLICQFTGKHVATDDRRGVWDTPQHNYV